MSRKLPTHVGQDANGRSVFLRETPKVWIECNSDKERRWPKGSGVARKTEGSGWTASHYSLNLDTIRPLTLAEIRKPLVDSVSSAERIVKQYQKALEVAQENLDHATERLKSAEAELYEFDIENK